jgi:hypothetical protein
MAIRRRCRGPCRTSRRCLEHLWFDVKHRGTRFRMPVNDFGVPRMEPNRKRPVESMEEVRDWERLFIGEIKAGRDPQIKPARKRPATDLQHVAGFLDAYLERHLKPAGIRSLDTAAGRLKVLKAFFGTLPAKALEDAEVVNRFKGDSEYARSVKIAAQGARAPRAAIRWDRPRCTADRKSSFHRFGVRLNTKAETVRDRRTSREEEKRLLDATTTMNTSEHRWVRLLHHDRCTRTVLPTGRDDAHSEYASIRYAHDCHAKQYHEGQEKRRIPFDPEGRLAATRYGGQVG